MNSEETIEKLKQLKIEDFIWLIYIGIIFLSWYSNTLERKYFIEKNLQSKEKYRDITTLIFTILVIVYIYFLKDSYKGIKNLKPWDTSQKKNLTYLSFIASLLIAISGIIFLYISLTDENIDVEIAFN